MQRVPVHVLLQSDGSVHAPVRSQYGLVGGQTGGGGGLSETHVLVLKS